MPGLVGVLVTLGMVVIAPMGLALLDTAGLRRLRRVWPVLGAVAGVALLLPRGATAVALVTPYAAACATVTACGLRRALRRREWTTRELTALTAAGSLTVAAVSLVAERAGVTLLGFSLSVHGLTVAHFHFAGFAAALLAGLTVAAAPGPLAHLGAAAVPLGTAVVAIGHFTGRWTELVGAVVLTVGLTATSWVAARHLRPHFGDRAARTLLLVASLATPATMALAVWFALGRATGLPHLSIADTAATHGVVNAVGVGLCGLLAWRRAGVARV